MGNCLWQSRAKEETEEILEEQVKESGVGKSSVKVKIVVSKEELEVLLLKLKENGGKSLEEVLGEVEKVRSEKVAGWRPSLESIMEDPEGPEMDR
ncbi:hypothetical protein SLE2022_230370 [Rubroshorea leprosula]